MKRKTVIFTWIGGILFLLIFLFINSKVEGENNQTESGLIRHEENYSYYMKCQGDHIVIYNRDHTIYEYTDLILEFLPCDVYKGLKTGIYFNNENELYDFLETYSS